ncbi:MAG: ABC transporter permease [Acidobacteriota bacterium]
MLRSVRFKMLLGLWLVGVVYGGLQACTGKPPFPEVEELVVIYEGTFDDPIPVPNGTIKAWRDSKQVFKMVSGFAFKDVELGEGEARQPARALIVSDSFLDNLGIAPQLGRAFLPGEGHDGDAPRVVMLSGELWQEAFDGSPEVIGQSVRVGEDERIIVGVVPPKIRFPTSSDHFDLLLPLATPLEASDPGDHQLNVVVRRDKELGGIEKAFEMITENGYTACDHPMFAAEITAIYTKGFPDPEELERE